MRESPDDKRWPLLAPVSHPITLANKPSVKQANKMWQNAGCELYYIKRNVLQSIYSPLPKPPPKRVCHIKSGLNFKWPILKMALLPTPRNFPQKYGMQIDRQQPLKNFNPLMAVIFSQLVKKVLAQKSKQPRTLWQWYFIRGRQLKSTPSSSSKLIPFFLLSCLHI